MTEKKEKGKQSRGGMNPYIVTALLTFLGLWCFYDGWLTSNPEMQKHQLFNRVLSFVFLPWAVYDWFKLRKYYSKKQDDPKQDLN